MKILVVILTSVLTFTGEFLTPKQKISVTVNNIGNNDGKVFFMLFNKETFMNRPIQSKSKKILNGTSFITFKNLEKGEYSIICFHDKNNNRKMDINNNGIPSEAYGVSNNIITFGPPSFFSTKFSLLDEDKNLEIKFY